MTKAAGSPAAFFFAEKDGGIILSERKRSPARNPWRNRQVDLRRADA
jgi:hypothetical protein